MASMAAKTIVTFHPDVACDVCGRRLLRGERPDVFLGGGQRRMVCELCTPRAAHEGWRREVEGQGAGARGQRPQRGRSLLGRLRQLREPARGTDASPAESGPAESLDELDSDSPRRARTRGRAAEWSGIEPEWTALDEEWAEMGGQPIPSDTPAADANASDAVHAGDGGHAPTERAAAGLASATPAGTPGEDRDVRRALEIFNGGETPRRIAGIARALGTASVNVSRAPQKRSSVAVVVAWELCWYRYEIDLDDELGAVRIAAEGMELEELASEDRVANAAADEHGMLSLLAG
jgi:hypothetical protein